MRVTTAAAGAVAVHATWVDNASGVITPGRTNTSITTATTTTVVASPAASTYRNVKTLNVRNTDGSSNIVTILHTDGTTAVELYKVDLGPGASLMYTEATGFYIVDSGNDVSESWHGNLYATYGRCDPQQLLRMATMAGTVAATPTNITTSIARISYFRPPADITVNRIRYYGVGATTSVYRVALYNGDTLARLMAETAFNTSANAWGAIGSGLGLTLSKDQLYFIACSVNATGTTAGVLCMGTTPGATTGAVNVLPRSWPGNLSLDSGIMDGGLAQGAVTTGALPDPFPTVAAMPTNWTGGMPLFFLDNNNA